MMILGIGKNIQFFLCISNFEVYYTLAIKYIFIKTTMKRILFLFLSSLFLLSVYAQLNADHNRLRAGDVIIKQQVEFKASGNAEPNQIWDFSELQLINDEYELVYSEAPLNGDSIYIMGVNKFSKNILNDVDLVIASEHNTKYYLYQSLDSLKLLGHENPIVKMSYIGSYTLNTFPMNLGQTITSPYSAMGVYSGTELFSIQGYIKCSADAFGKMILPTKDTINPVLRISTEQTILTADNANDNKGKIIKSYKWYSKGYRYPIFETVENIDLNSDSVIFATAFYYPLQDHLYLDTDPDNLKLLDDFWSFTKDKSEEISGNKEANFSPFSYNIYPNPVNDILHIEYNIEKGYPVSIIMTTIDGKIVRRLTSTCQEGLNMELVDCSGLVQGIYLLQVIVGDKIINEKLLKK